MKKLTDISRLEIQQAFDKAVSNSDLSKEGQLLLVTKEYYEKTLALARESFTRDETICKALELEWNPDFESLWRSVLEEDMSILLLDHETGDVMGFRTLMFEYANNNKESMNISHEKTKILVSLLSQVDKNCDAYNRFHVDQIVHFFAICINNKYRNRGLGYKLMKFAVEFLTNLDVKPLCIRVEGTSNISQHILEKLSFEKLTEVTYSNFRYDNKVVLKDTGEHKTVKGYALLIK